MNKFRLVALALVGLGPSAILPSVAGSSRHPSSGRKPSAHLYSVVDLGVGRPAAVNASRQVVGTFSAVGGKDWQGKDVLVTRAFLWENGTRRDLGETPLPRNWPRDFVSVRANGINNRGQVVGALGGFGPIVMSGLVDDYPFLESRGEMRLLGRRLWNSEAVAVNDRGQVVTRGNYRACLYDGGKIISLGTLSHVPVGNRSGANGLNDQCQVVGSSTVDRRLGPYFLRHAFLWQTGKMKDLGTLSEDNQSEATGINIKGQVVGSSSKMAYRERDGDMAMNRSRAFVWSRGKLIALETPGGKSSCAAGINDAGQVVGSMSRPWIAHSERACLWQQERLYDLNGTVPAASGWVLREAVAINNSGDIVGTGLFHGEEHAFLLAPGL